jgi:hypothetical protein
MRKPASLYQLKITLEDIRPFIWRRFVVPATIKLPRLHAVIQIVMGWEDCHMHLFKAGESMYGADPEPGGFSAPRQTSSFLTFSLNQKIGCDMNTTWETVGRKRSCLKKFWSRLRR